MGKHNRRGWRALVGQICANLPGRRDPRHSEQHPARLLPVYPEGEWGARALAARLGYIDFPLEDGEQR
ncbi:hypothetical protein [Nocardia spumae]|uniref:hypothetical protein n=1 Tax=Nocardia spumae TaxID=2887190 RepID=UPI001D154CC4|nr:hypothetical protein [Nocardia spumae]